MTAKELHKLSIKDLIDDEVEAIEGYDKAIEESDNPEAVAVFEHIKNEEVEHIAELEELDKMKAEDITSEQAWEDFKAGYTDFEEKHVSVSKGRDGDQASLGQKIDLMNAKLTELNTDVSRLNDAIPQALGTIEEAKTEETLAEEEMAVEGMEEGMMGEEDDGLSEFFDESGDEEGFEDEDGEPLAESEDEDVFEAESDAEAEESDVEGEEPAEEGDFEEEGEEVADEDEDEFIPLDELDSEEESEGEEEDEDEQDEILEKMVHILKKMDMRLTRLERENAGLRKQISKSMMVQATPARSEQRQRPQNLRLVKGSYNRPPVSTQYVANQRDIGVAKGESSGENQSVFRQELNEVFAECNRIANQTR